MSPFSRMRYRSRQFLEALLNRNIRVPDESLRPHLTPDQIGLFRRMQPSEQAHAFQVLKALVANGQNDPDLLTAALLHDCGKVRAPLNLVERIVIVLGNRLLPGAAKRWGTGEARGPRRPFVVAAQHPAWGAELAAAAGASGTACGLIRDHQDHSVSGDPLLKALQAVDDEK